MMKLESVIFHDILSSLYAKRIRAVHIHDAVIVPETKGNMIVFQKVCKSQIFYFCNGTIKNEYLWNLHMNKSRK